MSLQAIGKKDLKQYILKLPSAVTSGQWLLYLGFVLHFSERLS